MGWNSAYLEWIEGSTFEPVFVLEFVDGTSYGATGVGQSYKIASHPGVYGADEVKIAEGGIKTGSCSVTPGPWNYTAGAWSVTLAGGVGPMLNAVTRGSLARLRIFRSIADASSGMAGTGMTIALGVLQNVSGRPPAYTLSFWDIIPSLAGRRDTQPWDNPDDKVPLFWETEEWTLIATQFTGGDARLFVSSVDHFIPTTTGEAVAKVVPASGDPYYVAYQTINSSGSPYLTDLTEGIHDTTTVTGNVGDYVYPLPYLYGHVDDILRRILTSTGTGANGSHDVYPASWGFGIPYTWIDESDMQTWADAIFDLDASGTTSTQFWSTIIDAPIENAASWLSGWLAAAGVWLVTRQGEISIRCAQNPTGEPLLNDVAEESPTSTVEAEPVESGITITNSDISEIISHDLFDPSCPAETVRYMVNYWDTDATVDQSEDPIRAGVSPLSHAVTTFPAVSTTFNDLSDRLFSTGKDKARGAAYRLGLWTERVPEKIKLRCGGLRLSQLVPGDLVRLTTDQIVGRPDPRAGFYTRRVCMVTSVSIEWTRPSVQLTLSVLPTQKGI